MTWVREPHAAELTYRLAVSSRSNARIYRECDDRGVRPIIPLRETPDVKRGGHRAPTCEHGSGGSPDLT